jgi:hypothetical protein
VVEEGAIDLSGVAAALGQELPEQVAEKKPTTEDEDRKTEVGEPKPEESGTEAAAEDDAVPEEEDDPEAAENEDAVKDLAAESKVRVQKRIDKLTAQKKEHAELAETEKMAREQAEARVAELETELAEAKAGGTPAAPLDPQHELLAAESEADIAAYEAKLTAYEDFIDEHIDEGYTPDDPEKEGYTPAQLRKMQRTLNRERATLIPKARAALKQRTEANAEAKALYPDLFKPNSEMSVKAKAILADVPALKALPNAMILLGDALAKAAERAKPAAKKAPAKKEPPAVPVPAATPKPQKEAPRTKPNVDMTKIEESGGDADSLAAGVAALGIA